MSKLGAGTWLRLGYRPVTFAVDPTDGTLTHLWCGAVGRDLLLIWEAGNGDTGWGGVARVKLDPPALAWVTPLPGFSVGDPLLIEPRLHVTAIGFVGALDVRSGSFAWSHDDLYQGGSFDAFGLPRLEGSKVIFPVLRSSDEVVVDAETGKEIEPPDPQ